MNSQTKYMCRLLETIKIESKGLCNIEYHNKRFNRTRKELFGCNDFIDLKNKISISARLTEEHVYKCRIEYNSKIRHIEFQPYKPKHITSLKLVTDNEINYSYKFADRSNLDNLLSKRGRCDEILIVKNGVITDTSYSNVALFDGNDWITPKQPLLFGTMREYLIRQGIIKEDTIKIKKLGDFSMIMLINSMLGFEEQRAIPIERIIE